MLVQLYSGEFKHKIFFFSLQKHIYAISFISFSVPKYLLSNFFLTQICFAQIFSFCRILPDMSTNLEDEEEIVADNMYSSSEMDPLADPLALDDEIINQTVENESDFASENTTITDLDSSGDAQIILVDVNSLKSSFPMPVSYANDSYESNESVVRNNHIQNSELPAGTSEQNVNRDDDGIGVTYEPIALALDDEINDEVEGVRSDGSDSGLGLELSAGLLSEKPNETSPIGK